MKGIVRREFWSFGFVTLLFFLFISAPFPGNADAQLTLGASPPSSAPVGTSVLWSAAGLGEGYVYRFTVKYQSGRELIIRDYDIYYQGIAWTPIDEGQYQVKVYAKAGYDAVNSIQTDSESYLVTSRITNKNAVISPTQHPLVALYSVPYKRYCSKARVQFRQVGEQEWQSTPYKRYQINKSLNFLVAGMYPETTYEMRHEAVYFLGRRYSNTQTFTTGALEGIVTIPDLQVLNEAGADSSLTDGILLHAFLFALIVVDQVPQQILTGPVATDLQGNVLWYYADAFSFEYAGSFMMSFPTFVGGTFFMPMARPPLDPNIPIPTRGQLLREIDLAGNTVRETNVEIINAQLANMGFDPIYYFHHDVRRLPNGHTLVMAGEERVYSNLAWGEGGAVLPEVDAVGDMIIDLDENFQVVWAWSTFDHDAELRIGTGPLRDGPCIEAQPGFNPCGPAPSAGRW